MSRWANIAALLFAGLPFTAGAAGSADVQGAPVVAAATANAASPLLGSKDRVLSEVLVEGSPLWKTRKKMVQVEDKFYALYNKVNKDKDFDVHCHIETPTDRIIKERVCRVAFIENAQAVEVQALLDGHNAPPADMVAQARGADFEKHFLQVINSDPRLLKLVREREALGKKYDERHQEMSANHRWFRFER